MTEETPELPALTRRFLKRAILDPQRQLTGFGDQPLRDARGEPIRYPEKDGDEKPHPRAGEIMTAPYRFDPAFAPIELDGLARGVDYEHQLSPNAFQLRLKLQAERDDENKKRKAAGQEPLPAIETVGLATGWRLMGKGRQLAGELA